MGWLLSPLAWLLFASVLMPWGWLHRRRWLVAAGALVASVALAAMTPLGANALAKPLERSVRVPQSCFDTPPATVVVLGGGIEGWPRSDTDFSVLNLSSRRRMDGAIAWWRQGQGRTLVLQGGAPHPRATAVAVLMAAYARAQGVPESALRLEDRSGDTWENARHAAELSPRLPHRIVLATSLVHMPRAQRAFTHVGFDVCPLGTERLRLPSRVPWAVVPRTSALVNAEVALHEWVGLAYYRWRDRH